MNCPIRGYRSSGAKIPKNTIYKIEGKKRRKKKNNFIDSLDSGHTYLVI